MARVGAELALIAALSLGCAVGYAGHGRVIAVAIGEAEVISCPPGEPIDHTLSGCTVVHGGSMSEAFAGAIGAIVGVIAGLLG